MLFSCGEDKTIKCWDISNFECIQTLKIPKPYQGMNIEGVSGLTEGTFATLQFLGAVTGSQVLIN